MKHDDPELVRLREEAKAELQHVLDNTAYRFTYRHRIERPIPIDGPVDTITEVGLSMQERMDLRAALREMGHHDVMGAQAEAELAIRILLREWRLRKLDKMERDAQTDH